MVVLQVHAVSDPRRGLFDPEQARRWRERDPAFGPDGGETLQAFYDRVVGTLAGLARRHPARGAADAYRVYGRTGADGAVAWRARRPLRPPPRDAAADRGVCRGFADLCAGAEHRVVVAGSCAAGRERRRRDRRRPRRGARPARGAAGTAVDVARDADLRARPGAGADGRCRAAGAGRVAGGAQAGHRLP